jgi:DMSO reductase iron-sulfur subunit
LELPLLERLQQFDAVSSLAIAIEEETIGSLCGTGLAGSSLRTPAPGEQYRFHFDMTKCIGCKCCVVACNEQNGNPADILWRRVGEIEGGTYPSTVRQYLSVGCNHCLEPSCMTGCPVSAYSKDPLTGIVRHNADACIGCQYCTWNCSYGVPQYNPERGVVGKCDMCFGRLTRGQSPACVSACPEEAIQIELVNIQSWRGEYKQLANSPGMPSADDSISTTRITLPKRAPGDLQKVNLAHLRVEHPHWPLIVMTVLTQLSVGAFAAIWRSQAAGLGTHRSAAVIALIVAIVALCASTLHLGRPIHAMRALKMWRRSWLSREVLLFTLFAGAAGVYSVSLLARSALGAGLGALTVLLGIAGVGTSARLYLVHGRPAWNSPLTVLEFLSTAALLSSAINHDLADAEPFGKSAVLLAGLCTLIVLIAKVLRLRTAKRHELYASWQLLSTVLANMLQLRIALLIVGVGFAASSGSPWTRLAGLLLLIAGEFLGRYLFFVSVVPTNIATSYLAEDAA